jgi:hypothetical protein
MHMYVPYSIQHAICYVFHMFWAQIRWKTCSLPKCDFLSLGKFGTILQQWFASLVHSVYHIFS